MRQLLSVLALLVLAPPAKSQAAPPVYHQLTVEYPSGVTGRIVVNDVEVASFTDGAQGAASLPLDAWLDAANTLKIDLSLHARLKPAADAAVTATLRAAQPGQMNDEGATLLALTWKASDPLPKTLAGEFRAKTTPAHRLWAKAQPLVLDAASRKAILALAAELHRALSARDAKAFARLQSFKIEDLGRALGGPPLSAEEAARQMLGGLSKGARVEPLGNLELKLMGKKRIVRVQRPNGGAAVVMVDGNSSIAFEVFVARVDGELRLVR